MCIKSIMANVCPGKVWQKFNHNKKEMTFAEQILDDKRNVVNAYIKNPNLQFSRLAMIKDKELVSLSVDRLLLQFGDDLPKIQTMLGVYGLASYAELDPKELLPESGINITEYGYQPKNTVKNAFYNYLIINNTGTQEDLFKRFGLSGRILFEECKNSNLMQTVGDTSYHIPASRRFSVAAAASGKESTTDICESLRYFRF